MTKYAAPVPRANTGRAHGSLTVNWVGPHAVKPSNINASIKKYFCILVLCHTNLAKVVILARFAGLLYTYN
jgi:hypothetical protein